MDILLELLLNIMANVVAYFVCKWLDDELNR